MKNLTNKLIVGLIVLVVILGVAIAILWQQNRKNGDDLAAYKIALSNDFKTFTDKNGHIISQVQAAVFDRDADFKSAINQLNKNGANIQSKIDNQTQGLILLQKRIGGPLSGTTTIAREDTVKNDTLKAKNGRDSIGLKVYPVYAINDTTNKWYSLAGTVGYKVYHLTPLFRDSTELKPTLINGGFFKKSVLGIESLNHNPYAVTTGLKYLAVKKTPAPVWKLLEGIGIFAAGIFLGHKL